MSHEVVTGGAGGRGGTATARATGATVSAGDATAPSDRVAGRGLPRVRALDGLRGLAVLGVLLYHLGFSWMPGGFLGVSLFFTLSGFLITSLLLVEQERTSTIALRNFWSRRFRRLLPAAWAGVGLAIAVTLVAGDPDQLAALPGDVVGALGDVANWRFLLAGSPYLAGYRQPSPLLHFWSLAIEEQFYLLFPLIVAALVVRRISRRGWWLAMALGLAASMAATLLLYNPDDTSRVYFNTGSRVAEILAGVLLALALRGWWTWSAAPRRAGAAGEPSRAAPATPAARDAGRDDPQRIATESSDAPDPARRIDTESARTGPTGLRTDAASAPTDSGRRIDAESAPTDHGQRIDTESSDAPDPGRRIDAASAPTATAGFAFEFGVPADTNPGHGARAGAGVTPGWLTTPALRFVVPVFGILAVVGLWNRVATTDLWLYRGGLWAVAALSCVLVVATLVDGPVARFLALDPLVGLGVISYGVYVYHWPIFLWLSPERTGLGTVPLSALRLLATLGLALVSHRWFELPVRQGRVHLTPAVMAAIAASFVVLLAAGYAVGQRSDDRAVTAAADASAAAPIVTQPPISSPLGTAPQGGPAGTRVPIGPPHEVLFIGDSLLHQAYPVIADHFGQHGIATRAIGGPGQSLLGHDARWLGELRTAVDDDDPDVVVIETCCGHGDKNDPFHLDGQPLELDSDALWQAWEDTADQAVDIAQRDGRLVLWVLAPPAKTNGYYGPIEGRITRANQIAIDVAARHPGMAFVDWRVIAAPDGSFTESLANSKGELVKVRAFDGLHFTPAGMQVLAELTRTTVEESWQAFGGRRSTTRGTTPGTTVGSVPRRAPGTAPGTTRRDAPGTTSPR